LKINLRRDERRREGKGREETGVKRHERIREETEVKRHEKRRD